MAVCEKCGKTPCQCLAQDESKLYAYPKDPDSGEPGFVPEDAHYLNCPHCQQRYDRRDEQQAARHRHDKTRWGAS